MKGTVSHLTKTCQVNGRSLKGALKGAFCRKPNVKNSDTFLAKKLRKQSAKIYAKNDVLNKTMFSNQTFS